jgi:glutamate racemase
MLGIFDSGLGGLTVVREILKRLPNRPIIYFGDTARVPYGNKSEEVIKKYANEGVEFLLSRGAQVIILACNTMSAVAFDELKKKYSPPAGGVPIFEVITPAVKRALEVTKNGRIGVIGTRATINSKIYENKISKFKISKQPPHSPPISAKRKQGELEGVKIQVFSYACPLFVPLVEEEWFNNPETEKIAKEYLKPLQKAKVDTLILGCTHYPMLKKTIKKIMGAKVKIVDSAEEVAKEVVKFFEISGFSFSGTKQECKIFVSDKTEALENWVGDWLGEGAKVEKVSLEK